MSINPSLQFTNFNFLPHLGGGVCPPLHLCVCVHILFYICIRTYVHVVITKSFGNKLQTSLTLPTPPPKKLKKLDVLLKTRAFSYIIIAYILHVTMTSRNFNTDSVLLCNLQSILRRCQFSQHLYQFSPSRIQVVTLHFTGSSSTFGLF